MRRRILGGSGNAGHLDQAESSSHFISPEELILLSESFEPKMNENTDTCVLIALGQTNDSAADFGCFPKC